MSPPTMAQKAKPVTARIAAAGSGGPGMFRGCDYQLEYAVLQSLYKIWQHLYEPLKSFSIAIEPRIVHSGAVTRWDSRHFASRSPWLSSRSGEDEEMIESRAWLSDHVRSCFPHSKRGISPSSIISAAIRSKGSRKPSPRSALRSSTAALLARSESYRKALLKTQNTAPQSSQPIHRRSLETDRGAAQHRLYKRMQTLLRFFGICKHLN